MNKTLHEVILSYPKLFRASQINGQGAPKYSTAVLIHESNPELKEIQDIAAQLVSKKYPDGTPRNFKELPLYRAADDPKYANNPTYAGMWILNTSKNAEQGKPSIVDGNLQEVIDPGKIYPGLVANVAVSVYCYEAKDKVTGAIMSKGVTTGLEAVQIVRDGERLDNKPSAEELFKPLDMVGGAGGATGFNPLG